MKKKILSLVLLTCLSIPQIAVSAANEPTVVKTIATTENLSASRISVRSSTVGTTNANLNVRSGAGLSYSIKATLPKGTDVELSDSVDSVVRDGYVWVYISTLSGTKVSGWVALKYLDIEIA